MGGRGASSGISARSADKPLAVGETGYVQDWFIDKVNMPSYAMRPRTNMEVTIEGETEKAWKVSIYTETRDGERDVWVKTYVPKSVTMTKSAYEKDKQAREKEQDRRFKAGQAKYNKMLDFAKANNVKGVRVGLRSETILKKIEAAGLSYNP